MKQLPILLSGLGCWLLACQDEPQVVTVGRVDRTSAARAGVMAPASNPAGRDAAPTQAKPVEQGPAPATLMARIQSDLATESASQVDISCPDNCVELRASALGGNPPYRFTWDDGSSEPARRVCPSADTQYSVSVSDTPLQTNEFNRPAQASSAQLQVHVLPCDAAGGGVACTLSNGARLPSEATGNVVGMPVDPPYYPPVVYFADGAVLPAGRYRIAYVDGCFSCCVTLLDTFWLVGADTTQLIVPLPGGSPEASTTVAAVASCPVSVMPIAPVEFDHSGGPLGLWLSDGLSSDNINGDGHGGRSPTWRLSRLDPCPR